MAKRYKQVLLTMLVAIPLATTTFLTPVAARDMAIAAVVGEDAISSYEVDNRIKFIITTAHLSDTPDVVERIRPQVIRSLIDEKLQLQEAAKSNITIADKDVEEAIAGIESQRGMPAGTIYHMLSASNIPKETFMQQIRAQLSWNQLLTRKVRSHVRVSDEEIQLASKQYTGAPAKKAARVEQPAGATPEEFKIALIALPVDKPGRETEIRRLGEKLVKEVRTGASFEEVSRQFSSVAASSEGKVETFWVRLGQLDPHIARVLVNARAGAITDPIRTPEGFTIIKVYDTRMPAGQKATKEAAKPEEKPEEKPMDTEVTMKEILLKLKPDADTKEASVMLQVGEEVAKNPGTCDDKTVAGIDDLKDFDIDVTVHTQMKSELPPALKIIAENLKVGDISTPLASAEGIRLYMLCGKKEVVAKPVEREEVYRMLIQQKMDLEAQKYLRNLRRETFIDIR